MELKDIIKQIEMHLGFTHRALAEVLHTTENRIKQISAGNIKALKKEEIDILVNKYKLSKLWLLTGDGEMYENPSSLYEYGDTIADGELDKRLSYAESSLCVVNSLEKLKAVSTIFICIQTLTHLYDETRDVSTAYMGIFESMFVKLARFSKEERESFVVVVRDEAMLNYIFDDAESQNLAELISENQDLINILGDGIAANRFIEYLKSLCLNGLFYKQEILKIVQFEYWPILETVACVNIDKIRSHISGAMVHLAEQLKNDMLRKGNSVDMYLKEIEMLNSTLAATNKLADL